MAVDKFTAGLTADEKKVAGIIAKSAAKVGFAPLVANDSSAGGSPVATMTRGMPGEAAFWISAVAEMCARCEASHLTRWGAIALFRDYYRP